MELSLIDKKAFIYIVGRKNRGKSHLIDEILESQGFTNGLRYEKIMYTTRTIEKEIKATYDSPKEYVVVEHTFTNPEQYEVLKPLIGKCMVILAHQYPMPINMHPDYLIYFSSPTMCKKVDTVFYRNHEEILSRFVKEEEFSELCDAMRGDVVPPSTPSLGVNIFLMTPLLNHEYIIISGSTKSPPPSM
jgi:hypothetical protein